MITLRSSLKAAFLSCAAAALGRNAAFTLQARRCANAVVITLRSSLKAAFLSCAAAALGRNAAFTLQARRCANTVVITPPQQPKGRVPMVCGCCSSEHSVHA